VPGVDKIRAVESLVAVRPETSGAFWRAPPSPKLHEVDLRMTDPRISANASVFFAGVLDISGLRASVLRGILIMQNNVMHSQQPGRLPPARDPAIVRVVLT